MTTPSSQQQAAELLPEDVFAKCRHERVAEIAAALDAARTAGEQAEAARWQAKIEALIRYFGRTGDVRAVEMLRAALRDGER